MPGGSRWCTTRPEMIWAPTDELWRIHDRTFCPISPNPHSKGRLALVGSHGMLYAANSLPGAVWETLLRYSVFHGRNAEFDISRLKDQCASRIRLRRDDIPLLELGRPGLLALFPDGDGPEVAAVNDLLTTPAHHRTHEEARRLFEDLRAVGIGQMPMLSWPSRQFQTSTVYLAYSPPMEESWWEQVGDPIALDDPELGHDLIQHELALRGFTWRPISAGAEDPLEP